MSYVSVSCGTRMKAIAQEPVHVHLTTRQHASETSDSSADTTATFVDISSVCLIFARVGNSCCLVASSHVVLHVIGFLVPMHRPGSNPQTVKNNKLLN